MIPLSYFPSLCGNSMMSVRLNIEPLILLFLQLVFRATLRGLDIVEEDAPVIAELPRSGGKEKFSIFVPQTFHRQLHLKELHVLYPYRYKEGQTKPSYRTDGVLSYLGFSRCKPWVKETI